MRALSTTTTTTVLLLTSLLLLLVATVACDTDGVAVRPSLSGTLSLEAAYVAPLNGPSSSGYITVQSTRVESVTATFELSLDDGESYLPLPLLDTDAAGASIVAGNTIVNLPAQEFVEFQWTTAGLARTAALSPVRLRVLLDDGTHSTTLDSQPFLIDNTASDNAEPVLELIYPDGNPGSFTDTMMVPTTFTSVRQGTWTIRGSDPDYFDALELTVTFDEANSYLGAYGTDLADFFDLAEPELTGTPPTATAIGGGTSGVSFELTRTLPDLQATTSFVLRFEITLSDGEHTLNETLIFGHYPTPGQDHVFVLDASTSMSFGVLSTSPVYGPGGNLISNPTPIQAAVSDIALAIDSLTANDRFDVIVSYGTQYIIWAGALQDATAATKQAAIAYLYSVTPSGIEYLQPALDFAFTNPAYATADKIHFYSDGLIADANTIQASFATWMGTKSSSFALNGWQYGGASLMAIMAWIDAQAQCQVTLR